MNAKQCFELLEKLGVLGLFNETKNKSKSDKTKHPEIMSSETITTLSDDEIDCNLREMGYTPEAMSKLIIKTLTKIRGIQPFETISKPGQMLSAEVFADMDDDTVDKHLLSENIDIDALEKKAIELREKCLKFNSPKQTEKQLLKDRFGLDVNELDVQKSEGRAFKKSTFKIIKGELSKPHACSIENVNAIAPVLITCDHASNYIPEELNNLGIKEDDINSYISYDIGALDLSRALAKKLNATLIYPNYSRLLFDLNRHFDDPSSIPLVSEGTEIPGNISLSNNEKKRRYAVYADRYHYNLSYILSDFKSREIHPVILSIHTFSSINRQSPHIGVLWESDNQMAVPFMRNLKQNTDLIIGDNCPYTPKDPLGYTYDHHAKKRGLPYLFIQIRQDLVSDVVEIRNCAAILCHAIFPLLKNKSSYSIDSKIA